MKVKNGTITLETDLKASPMLHICQPYDPAYPPLKPRDTKIEFYPIHPNSFYLKICVWWVIRCGLGRPLGWDGI